MDVAIKAISKKHNVKISIVNITESMKEILALQKTNPIAGVVLSRITAANTLISLDLKNGELMNTTISPSDGYLGKIITEFKEDKIRSFIQNADFDPTKIIDLEDPFSAALGQDGIMVVGQYLQNYEPHISTVNLTGGIDANFMEYLRASNQVRSLIMTRATLDEQFNVEHVVGILIQILPNHTWEDIDYLERKIGNYNFVTDILIKTFNYHDLIKDIIDDAEILTTRTINFACTCNKEKVLNAIKLLNKKEIKEMIQQNEPAIVHCEFCKKEYQILIDELKQLNN
ncbi:heat shock protein 33 [Williamsoniiplasma luminosum]|uniref:Heat shock protein 33 n=1 Tax=Williamsoniiplasma luminosum TaxID=214888 RepID=A0A2K8NSP6_9MOLU|nr:Hsp33 family molecular chaperone HslO [Williamsoniiplasma luminosum]ATZ16875.1 heat shock protein 33 [Williamsoniiplasma luminosum]